MTVYRIGKSFAAVHFKDGGKGQIVFLPAGAELLVVGISSLAGCLEVQCEDQVYNMFKADLLGPWAMEIETRSRAAA